MLPPRNGIAPSGGGPILGHADTCLLTRTSTLSLVVEAESEHKKNRERYR